MKVKPLQSYSNAVENTVAKRKSATNLQWEEVVLYRTQLFQVENAVSREIIAAITVSITKRRWRSNSLQYLYLCRQEWMGNYISAMNSLLNVHTGTTTFRDYAANIYTGLACDRTTTRVCSDYDLQKADDGEATVPTYVLKDEKLYQAATFWN